MVRAALDRLFVALVVLVLRALFRSVEVEGRRRIPAGRPILIVANHFNGFVDPVLLVHLFGRLPRFFAKASLWRNALARPFLALVGLLPVHRPEDDPKSPVTNDAVFDAAHGVLRRRGLVAIFPEGTTHDSPALARIRTGAARLALGARAAGVRGLVIVPVGLVFDDKLVLRSRALARIGEPIDLDAEIGALVPPGESEREDNRAAVRSLTQEIEARLRAVSPDFRDFREAAVLSRAAEIARRSRGSYGVTLARREELAQRLAYAPPAALDELMDALARYHLDLDLLGLRDHQLVPGYTPAQLLREFLTTALVVAVLSPLALVGFAANIVPYWCVQAAGRATREPVTKGTVRALVALGAFPLTWLAIPLVGGAQGVLPRLAVLALLPVAGLVAVTVSERLIRARRSWRGWQGLRERRALLGDILADRSRLVAAVERAARQVPPEHQAQGGSSRRSEDVAAPEPSTSPLEPEFSGTPRSRSSPVPSPRGRCNGPRPGER